jgi:NADPH:quinone reductase
MKAIISRDPGGPDVLSFEEVPTPEPGAGDALIAVEACGVNYPDWLLIQDRYQLKAPRPFSPGSEVCGIVRDLGSGVTSLAVGDRVIGRCGWGGMAQFVCIPEHKCLKIDRDMPAEHAATFLFGYGTS